MQHAVPSRSVCVAYQGMTVPLPASALCGLPGSSSSSAGRQLRTHVVNSLSMSEERQKDSGIQSQFTSERSCNGSAASSPACTENDIMERGELIQSDQQQPAHRGEDLDERKSGNNHTPSLLELPTECLHTSVGLADTASLPVPAAYDPMDTPPPLALAEPFLTAEVDYAEPSPTPGELPAALPNEKAGTTSAGDKVKGKEPSSSVRSTVATAGWSQVGRGRTLMHILSSRPVGRGQASADCGIPVGQHLPRSGPVLEVKETETSPSTLTQPISVGPGQGQAVSSGQKTQRSSRKAKVSLAIKFQGADASQHSAAGSSPGPQNSAPAGQVCLKASPQVLMKPSEFRVSSTEHLHMQSGAPEPPKPASAQGRNPGLAHAESEGSRVMPACVSGVEEGVLHSQALSSDGDELDFVETRGGRSANELEKSIAGHQRSIHRNQVCCVYVSLVRARDLLGHTCTIIPADRAEEDSEEEQSNGGRAGRRPGRAVSGRTGGGRPLAGGYSRNV